ncbi:lipopolysaccharide biosynthesis protein [Modestobacter sp. URMC 112]
MGTRDPTPGSPAVESRDSPLTRPPGQLRSVSWVAVCIVGSGVLTYAYLALVARALPAEEYSWFGSYWSLALVIGFGAFLPVELELARLLSLRGRTRPLPRGTAASLAGLTAAGAAALLASAAVLVPSLGGDAGFLFALLAVCLVSPGQFLLRGLLLGTGRLGMHGVVLLVDSGLRVVFATGLTVLVPGADAADYAWTLVAAMALAHLPYLALALRRRPAAAPQDGADADAGSGRPFTAAISHLLVGSLCAQVLLNAAPVVITALADGDEQTVAARFVASYTLVRLPLFVAVPLQSALIPLLTRVQAEGDAATLRRIVGRGLAAVAGLCAAGAAVGLFAGPALVSLVFGARYALTGPQIAVLALGSALHLGLLVASQALVASARHRQVAVVWVTGLAAAGVLLAAVPDLVLRAGLAFTVGSGAALAVAAAVLLTTGPRDTAGAARAPLVSPGGTPT